MNLKLCCRDYGFDCDFVLSDKEPPATIKRLRDHFEDEHGIDYAMEAVIQMITNRGHSLESIRV